MFSTKELPSDQVLIIVMPLNLNGTEWEEHQSYLSKDEQKKTLRYHFEADRLCFAECRRVLRETLGPWLGIPSMDVMFRFGKHGKPYLDHLTDIQFNVSHTQGKAVLAFARGQEVGIDIENTQRKTDTDGVARKVFNDTEQEKLSKLKDEPSRELFFRLWTAKEAFLKATGRGLSLDPKFIKTTLPASPSSLGTFSCSKVQLSEELFSVEIPCPSPFQATLCAPKKLLKSPPLITIRELT